MAREAALDVVRLELGSRVAAIDERASRMRGAELAGAIDEIRLIAHAAGLNPTVTVAHFIEAALARGETGMLMRGWLEMLRDAIGCERQDVAACGIFAAACSVRLAG